MKVVPLFRRILPNFHSRGNYQSNSQVVLLTLITSKCGVWKCLKKIYPKGQLAPRWWVSDHGNLWEPGEEDREGLLRFEIGLTQLGIAPSSCGNHSLTRREKGRLIEREPLRWAGRKKHSLIPLISSHQTADPLVQNALLSVYEALGIVAGLVTGVMGSLLLREQLFSALKRFHRLTAY